MKLDFIAKFSKDNDMDIGAVHFYLPHLSIGEEMLIPTRGCAHGFSTCERLSV